MSDEMGNDVIYGKLEIIPSFEFAIEQIQNFFPVKSNTNDSEQREEFEYIFLEIF